MLLCGFILSGMVLCTLCLRVMAQMTVSDLPLQIPGTSIVLLGVEPYSGIYFEDGGCEFVENIAAALFRNIGPCTVSESEVTLILDGKTSVFSFSMIPPGQAVLVLDQNRNPLRSGRIDSYAGWEITQRSVSCSYVKTQNLDDGFSIYNTGVLTTGQIYIRFKTYDDKRRIYVGGITYEVSIDPLGPGDSKTVRPWYYHREASRILEISIKKQSASE